MAEHTEMDKSEEHLAMRRRAASSSEAGNEMGAGYATTLLRALNLGERGNSPARAQVLLNMQRIHGNRAVQRHIQRDGMLPVQRNVASSPRKSNPGGSALGAIWDALLKQLEKLPVTRPEPGEEWGPVAWDQDGKVLERIRPQKPRCEPSSFDFNGVAKEQICPDPWDWSRNIITDLPPRKPEKLTPLPPRKPEKLTPFSRGTNPPTPAYWEDGSE